MKIFDFKSCKLIAGKKITGDYWITDGHVALNPVYFDTKIFPVAFRAMIEARTDFVMRGKNEKIETDASAIPAIEKIIPSGPRYILKDSRLTHADGVRILYGTDRTVCVDAEIFGMIEKYCIRKDFYIFQNYDQPMGPLSIWHNGQGYETEFPMVIVMPKREGSETFREILSNVDELNRVFDKMKKQAAA